MDFLQSMASGQPLPAGGAAAAHTASLGIALLRKALLLKARREESLELSKNLRVVEKELDRLGKDLERLVAKDPELYRNYVVALRQADAQRKKEALLQVLESSLLVMEKAWSGIRWAARLKPLIPEPARTHLRVSAELFRASAEASAHVARSNLSLIRHPEKRRNYLARLDLVRRDFHAECATVLNKLSEGAP